MPASPGRRSAGCCTCSGRPPPTRPRRSASPAALLTALVAVERTAPLREPATVASVLSGLVFIRDRPLILGAISLDLFVVLLGGATALLPIYARDVLEAGPVGLGLLRAAPGVGALMMVVVLANRPLRRGVGPILFASVTVFGLATIVFGLSTSMPLSLAALAILGAANVVSVVIRWSLIQTPDAMRGRVTAVKALLPTGHVAEWQVINRNCDRVLLR